MFEIDKKIKPAIKTKFSFSLRAIDRISPVVTRPVRDKAYAICVHVTHAIVLVTVKYFANCLNKIEICNLPVTTKTVILTRAAEPQRLKKAVCMIANE